ncbi:hypothetical protein CLIB1423_11S00518 [[Candida] railenensis]|uniref:UBX domain-containing protein n=1 Tax=[Candida] railenensis TaxID=45579 RepID=A0A9P0QRX0_9ASCO|nr:hypothetical protein CLIB1423_11S00518 [[Candida] railenensis]
MDEDTRRDLIEQFRAVTGLAEDSDANITDLLTVNGWNLNNSISVYFDTGFDSISAGVNPNQEYSHQSPIEPSDDGNTGGVSSGVEEHESTLYHREDSRSVSNLQSELFFDNYIPKLPKAPKISNHWHLEIGLNLSLIDSSRKEGLGASEDEKTLIDEKSDGVSTSNASSPRTTTLWIILLFIPKSLLSILVSIFRYLFGGVAKKVGGSLNNFPKRFNYSTYNPEKEDKLSISVPEPSPSRGTSSASVVSSSFNDAYSDSQSKYSWLLVILTNNDRKSSQLAQSFLTNPEFGKLEDLTLYTNNIETSREAFEVGKTYKVKKLPYVMLIGNVTNNPSIMSSMSIVYKSNIALSSLENDEKIEATVSKVYRGLSKVIEHFSPQLITKRIDQQEIEYSRIIKEQQDAAYIESLALDKKKKMEKEYQVKMEQDQQKLANLRKLFLLSRIQNGWIEDVIKEDISSGNKDYVKVAIKLPKGKRIIEVFKKQISTIELYLFVELKLYINELVEDEENEEFNDENDVIMHSKGLDCTCELELSEYVAKFPFKFELIQPFPKKVIELVEEKIGEVKELKNGGSLLFEWVEEDDDDEDE